MKKSWKDYLKKFYNKTCKIGVTVNDAWGGDFLIYIFDSEKNKDNVKSIIENVLGSWEFVYKSFKKPQGSLMMFATMFDVNNKDEDPFSMTEGVLFYDADTGEVYKYEEADYSPLTKSSNVDEPYKLDELKIKTLK